MSKGSSGQAERPAGLWTHLESFIREHVRGTVQQLLEEEVTDRLGREKSVRRGPVDSHVGFRNGYGRPRLLATMGGTIQLRRPRVRGLEERFESRVLPLFVRKTTAVEHLIPELYLHGLSQGDFDLALRGLLGEAAPLSPSSVERLRSKWVLEYEAWSKRRLDDKEVVYCWADGVYVKAGLEREKSALLVIIGAMLDGTKEVLAIVSGYRESHESWLGVFRDLADRGLTPPVLLSADGIPGLWSALAEAWPTTLGQRCWNHKTVNVLDKLPKKLQSEALDLLRDMAYAPTREEAEEARSTFAQRFRRDYQRAVDCLFKDWSQLTTFFNFPAQHWKHLRTTNVIESPFASVRLRTNAAKRYKKATSAVAVIYKILTTGQRKFRRLNAPELLPLVYARAEFINGQLAGRELAVAHQLVPKELIA